MKRPRKPSGLWTCPNPDCINPETGRRSRWPLHQITKFGKSKKASVCPRCKTLRPATDAERSLLESPDVANVVGAIAASVHANYQNLTREHIEQHLANLAIAAAIQFIPYKGSRFTSYLYGYLTKETMSRGFGRKLEASPQSATIKFEPIHESIADPSGSDSEQSDLKDTVQTMIASARLTVLENEWVVKRFGLFGNPQLSEPHIFPDLSDDRRREIRERAMEKLQACRHILESE